MTRLLNLRSIRAAIARGERRLADLARKRADLVRSIEQLREMLPERFPLMSQEDVRRKVLGEAPNAHDEDETTAAPPGAVTFHRPAYRYIPDTPEQPQVEYVERPAIVMPKGKSGPATTTTSVPATEPYFTTTVELPDASMVAKLVEQASGTAAIIAKQMGDAVGERVDAIMEGRYHSRSKGGWPRGLSRKLTPCPHSAVSHRHRVDDPSKPTGLTCVGITYPEKATAP